MQFAMYAALFFTVVLLVITTYFLLGGLPLLVLKHDTPLDARFIRSFFNVYYKVAFFAAGATSISYALWGRFGFAVGVAAFALVAWLLRKSLIPAMEQLDAKIQANHDGAVRRFRQVHGTTLFLNLVQLVALVWTTTKLTL